MGVRITTVNIGLSASKLNYKFPNDASLTGKKIIRFSVRTSGGKAFDGTDLPSTNVLNTGFVTIKQANVEYVTRVPLRYFDDAGDCDCRCQPTITNFNAEMSEIYFSAAPVNGTTLEFVICYEDLDC